MASRSEYQMDFLLNAQLNGSFSGATSKAQQEFARLGNEIQKLNKAQNDIQSYQKTQTAIENTKKKLENYQKQYDLVEKEIEENGDATGELEREKLKLQQRIDSTNQSLQNQEARLDATGQRLTDAGVDTANLGEETDRLTREIEELTEEQRNAENQTESFGDSMADAFDKMSQAIDILGLQDKFAAIADAYKECVDIAAQLESTMSNVEAISGSSGSEMDQLTEKAKEMGATTKFTAVEAGDAFSYMAMADSSRPTAWRHAA